MLAGSTVLCLTAAALFWACNAIQIILGVKQSSKWGSTDKETYLQLLPDNIMDDWMNKLDYRGLEYASGFLKGAFWIVFCLPIIELAWILSRNGTRNMGCNFGIMLFVLGGSWTKWFSSIFWNGMYISFVQLAKHFNLENWLSSIQAATYQLDGEDGIGWRTLEVNYISSRGLVWIVNSVEWVCLAAIFTLTFYSVMEWRKEDQTSFGGKWNALGLFIGLLCAIEFVSELIGFEGYKIAWVFVVLYAALNRLILIPLWIIILGFQLPKATSKQFDSVEDLATTNGDLELTEDQQQRRQQRPSAFTIDEDDENDSASAPAGPASPPAAAFASANSLEDSQKS